MTALLVAGGVVLGLGVGAFAGACWMAYKATRGFGG